MALVKDLRLNRFQTAGFDGHQSVSIICGKGSIWITAGKGFDDIVLKDGQQISFIADKKIVIEALSDSHISVHTHLSSNELKAVN